MNGRAEDLAPLARTKGLVVRELDGETLVYDRERDWAQCLNAATAAIWRQCDGVTSVAEMAEALSVDTHTIFKGLAELSKYGLLEDRIADPEPRKISRRGMLIKGGVAVAAVPLITTVVRPGGVAYAACNCSSGSACTTTVTCDGGPLAVGLHQGCACNAPGTSGVASGCCGNAGTGASGGHPGCCAACSDGGTVCGICSGNVCQAGGASACFSCTG